MTLDPVHFEGIARLAARIQQEVDDTEQHDLAARAWEEFLDPLRGDGRAVLEPIDGLRRRRVSAEDVAIGGSAYPSSHGLDSGTINPRTFKNGLVLDVAQAAMSACPSDLDVHRSRTVVATVHSNDETISVEEDHWEAFDEGYGRGRIIHAPRVNRYERAVVHALSLYLAESSHALANADAVEDLLILDGPIYPKGILSWLDRHHELASLLAGAETPREVLGNYIRLVETFAERDIPLVGFVKNVTAKGVIRALRESGLPTPWGNDAAFFTQILDAVTTEELAVTNWFLSRTGPDRVFAADNDELDLDAELEAAAYEVAYCVVYDPRTDLIYKLETPAIFAADPDRRERLTQHVLGEIATRNGPPAAVSKADDLARIGNAERESLIETIERTFETQRDRTYDDTRWEELEQY
ncbi:MAG: DNA double-strand break repair nuclease NurA [Halobacteriales archaeon]|nr:DNA double-strand break repair nuclease NurA [Halobacteriales archaeon]